MIRPEHLFDSGEGWRTAHLLRQTVWQIRNELREKSLTGSVRAATAGMYNALNSWLASFRPPRFRCVCCGYKGYFFLHRSNRLRIAWNSVCPICDSRSRHRGLALLIPELIEKRPGTKRVLHFAPEPLLGGIIRRAIPSLTYHTTDLEMKDVDFPGEDIQNLSLPSETYDLVLCNHVIEHVPHDDRAISEMSRVLVRGGVALITIPGDWEREHTVVFPDLTLNGHYRDYGLDVVRVFGGYFASVKIVNLHDLGKSFGDELAYGIRKNDVAFVCHKSK